MERGYKIFYSCLKPEAYSSYINKSAQDIMPDVCICGNIFSKNGANFRRHCQKCKGLPKWDIGYEMQRLELSLNIHHTWLEFGFATAISLLERGNENEYS